MWVKASELKNILGSGFSPSTIKRRRQNGSWKPGVHYRIITPKGMDPRFQYNAKTIEQELKKA